MLDGLAHRFIDASEKFVFRMENQFDFCDEYALTVSIIAHKSFQLL